MVSLFVSSQKFKTLPTSLRVVSSVVITFQLAPIELKSIEDELLFTSNKFESIATRIFEEGKHFIICNIKTNKIFKEFELYTQ